MKDCSLKTTMLKEDRLSPLVAHQVCNNLLSHSLGARKPDYSFGLSLVERQSKCQGVLVSVLFNQHVNSLQQKNKPITERKCFI